MWKVKDRGCMITLRWILQQVARMGGVACSVSCPVLVVLNLYRVVFIYLAPLVVTHLHLIFALNKLLNINTFNSNHLRSRWTTRRQTQTSNTVWRTSVRTWASTCTTGTGIWCTLSVGLATWWTRTGVGSCFTTCTSRSSRGDDHRIIQMKREPCYRQSISRAVKF